MHIIVGLGNPGEQYKNTRHNAGFMAIDALAEILDANWQTNKKFNAEIIISKEVKLPIGSLTSAPLILVKPLTFMNNSGAAVRAVMGYYNLLPKKMGLVREKDSDLSNVLTVIHDDIDIVLGQYKLADNSRSAGHKGVNSIINHLKTRRFRRIRIGIRTEIAGRMPTEKFVLDRFSREERKIIDGQAGKISEEALDHRETG